MTTDQRSSTGPRFRTPADVRAIPNERWEEWLRTDTLPFPAFYPTRGVQTVLRTVIRATRRRTDAARR